MRGRRLAVLALIGGVCAAEVFAGAATGAAPLPPLGHTPPPPVLKLSINGRAVTVEYPAAHDAEAVMAAVRAMGPSAVPQAQPGVPGGLRAHCRLEGDASDPVAGRFELTCNQWRVTFVRLCPEGACRYATIDRMYLRAEPPPLRR